MLVFGVAGCGNSFTPGQSGPEVIDGNRNETTPSPLGKTQGEPNGSFDDALIALFDDTATARLQGTIPESSSGTEDVDVFQLGAMHPGDRIIVDAATPNSPLDINIALFDDMERLVSVNDDRDWDAGDIDSYIDVVARHAGELYYLVVSASAFAGDGHDSGSYSIDIEVESGMPVPAPAGQTLLLDFTGGELYLPRVGTILLDPFDAADIAPRYADQTKAMKKWIQATVEQNFERFDVTVCSTDDPMPEEEFSTLFFGGFSEDNNLGFASGVDEYNADHCDDAVIYTENFDPVLFFFPPTTREMATAIGNVASHEAGHILGLNHVDDERALMDTESAATALLTDQEFRQAPLNHQIAPIGVQDAALLLTESLGLTGEGNAARRVLPSAHERFRLRGAQEAPRKGEVSRIRPLYGGN